MTNPIISQDDPRYQRCSRTVMDNIADPDIRFDEEGVSNYAREFHAHYRENIPENPEQVLEKTIAEIREKGKGKPYDCLTGISGGVDSSYMILKAKDWGLRPLIVHFDNGWNSEIAVRNIKNIIKVTGFDLDTLVVDWEEFRDLQLSYIKAGVVDLEVPTDHAIYATWYKLARKFKIDHVLSGNNYITESIMPPSWIFNKADAVNLTAIHERFGTKPFKTYPVLHTERQAIYQALLNIKTVKPLNLIPYRKDEAKQELATRGGWADYGGKHYESFYTKFYQAYILPRKFHIDKRKAHLSNLILSGEITREMALEELAKPLYGEKELREDVEYFTKKLGITPAFFEQYLDAPRQEHRSYGVQRPIKERYPLLKALTPLYKMLKGK